MMLLWCVCVILESSSPTVFAEKSTNVLLLCFTEEIQTGFKEKSTSVQIKVSDLAAVRLTVSGLIEFGYGTEAYVMLGL